MHFQSETDMLLTSLLGGLLVGLALGVIPLLVGYIKGLSRGGATALLLCGVFGAIGGWVMAGIMALLSFLVLLQMPSAPAKPKRVPCPHCAEWIMPGAKVCRFCGRSLKKT